MYIEIGTSDRRRCIDIKNVISEIREEVCLALLALRLFGGNYYTSGFYGIDKVNVLEIFIQSEHHIKTFKAIGDQFAINAELFLLVEKFACELYGLSQSPSMIESPYKKFYSKKKSSELQQLPPTHDALLCYMERVNYMTTAIQKSLIPCPVIPSPCEDYGWIIKDDLFQIQWMLWKPVPNELFELISCSNRKSKCLGNQCVCRSHGLPYTDLCNWDSCENQSEDTSDDVFDENENEVEITEDELEYESSDND